MRAVIADTGPLYAAFDPSDQYHAQSQTQLRRLESEDIAVVVSYPTALEAYSLVMQRLGTQLALTFVENLVAGSDLINPSANDYLAAMQRVARFPDQKITLFDALIAVMALRLNLSVWTYDYHFDVMRVQVWR